MSDLHCLEAAGLQLHLHSYGPLTSSIKLLFADKLPDNSWPDRPYIVRAPGKNVCLCGVQMANASLPMAKKYPVFLTADDIKGLEGLSIYMKEESGYAEIQKTKPDTIGYALNDSPAGESLLFSFSFCAQGIRPEGIDMHVNILSSPASPGRKALQMIVYLELQMC